MEGNWIRIQKTLHVLIDYKENTEEDGVEPPGGFLTFSYQPAKT